MAVTRTANGHVGTTTEHAAPAPVARIVVDDRGGSPSC